MQRSVTACSASILELDVAEVPVPDEGHPQLPAGRLAPEEARRNLVTRGIELNALVGTHFRVGDVECFGQRLCEPCAHLERLTAEAGRLARCGRSSTQAVCGADVLSDGVIRVGDDIAAR